MIEWTSSYGHIGQHLKVEHLNIWIISSPPIVGPDDPSIADGRFHLDASRGNGEIRTRLDIIEIDVRVVVEISDVAAMNPGIGLHTRFGDGGILACCQVFEGNIGFAGAVICPGNDGFVDRGND